MFPCPLPHIPHTSFWRESYANSLLSQPISLSHIQRNRFLFLFTPRIRSSFPLHPRQSSSSLHPREPNLSTSKENQVGLLSLQELELPSLTWQPSALHSHAPFSFHAHMASSSSSSPHVDAPPHTHASCYSLKLPTNSRATHSSLILHLTAEQHPKKFNPFAHKNSLKFSPSPRPSQGKKVCQHSRKPSRIIGKQPKQMVSSSFLLVIHGREGLQGDSRCLSFANTFLMHHCSCLDHQAKALATSTALKPLPPLDSPSKHQASGEFIPPVQIFFYLF